MKQFRHFPLLRTTATVALLFLLLAGGAPCIAQATETALAACLPDEGFHPGWKVDGTPETFGRDTLYEHINGEAELYLPYGFEEAVAGYYIDMNTPKSGVAVDIYRMGSPLDAFGIYSRYRNPEALPTGPGVEGESSDTQVSFFQDRYFVRITSSGRVHPTRDVLQSCANAAAAKLPSPASWPSELAIIRAGESVPRTEQFVTQSLLGYRFFPRGLTADATLDGKPVKLFVVFTDSPASAAACLDAYAASGLQPGGKPAAPSASGTHDALSVQDPLYKNVIIRQSGSRLFGIAKADDPAKAAELLERWISRVESPAP
ncbi:MAG TPA: hypothetical protein PLP29_03445 [Candidatus Ozemobacteraceae bacterium]|nr:hypothetical protein [Candidatus Ozemobacteraceae bacterium]